MLALLLSLWRALQPMWWRGGRSTVPPNGGRPATPEAFAFKAPEPLIPRLRAAYPDALPDRPDSTADAVAGPPARFPERTRKSPSRR